MDDKFKIIIPAVIIIALFGTLLVIFADVHSDYDSNIVSGLGTVTKTNVTVMESYLNTDRLANNTRASVSNTTKYVNFIRSTPKLTCSKVYIYYNATGTGASLHTMLLPSQYYSCSDRGELTLKLTGNYTNGSKKLGRGFKYNITYTAALYGASWNVSQKEQEALGGAGGQLSTYYTLIILVVILSVVLVFFGIEMSTGGFGGGGEGGGFDIGSVWDKFER